MAGIYRFSLKSEEQRGATQPNILEIGLASDADAALFAVNLSLAFTAHVVSWTLLMNSDYSLPYPVGTDSMSRTALTDGIGNWQNVRIYDTPTPFDPTTRTAALITAGFQIVSRDGTAFYVPVSGNCQVFTPGHSV